MRLTLPDPSHPTQSRTFDYPDAPFEGFLRWLTALPLWQRPPNAVSQRLSDLLLTLATLRASGAATEVVRGDPPIEVRAIGPEAPPAIPETPGQARARRMREGKAAKAAARLTGSVS